MHNASGPFGSTCQSLQMDKLTSDIPGGCFIMQINNLAASGDTSIKLSKHWHGVVCARGHRKHILA